jgi:hypothetical protein
MAEVAAHLRPPGDCNGFIAIIVPQVFPVRSRAGKHRAFQVPPMTGPAGTGVSLVEILMPQIPPAAGNVMHPVGTVEGKRQTGVTGTALDDGAGMPLQLGGSQVVIGGRLRIRPDRMRGPVTALAGDIAMPQTVAVKRIAVSAKRLLTASRGVAVPISLSQACNGRISSPRWRTASPVWQDSHLGSSTQGSRKSLPTASIIAVTIPPAASAAGVEHDRDNHCGCLFIDAVCHTVS